jgi:hypothetical protein
MSNQAQPKSLDLVTKLFGLSLTIALAIKYGIKAVIPSFAPTSGEVSLDPIATIAILTPSLVIALILWIQSRNSEKSR